MNLLLSPPAFSKCAKYNLHIEKVSKTLMYSFPNNHEATIQVKK